MTFGGWCVYNIGMQRKNYKFISVSVIVLGLLAAVFVEPSFFNRGIEALNDNFGWSISRLEPREFMLGLDLEGGVELLYEADLSEIEPANRDEAMAGLRDVIERRINIYGVREPEVETIRVGDRHRLSVKIPGIADPQQAIEEIGRTPFLEFREPKENYQEIEERNREVWQTGEGEIEDPFQPGELTGRYLENASIEFDPTTHEPYVGIEFDAEGAQLFEEITARNIGKPVAIVIDEEMISAPIVQSKITGGQAQITGNFTVAEARELASNLRAGALPVPIGEPISQITIGPTLGRISLEQSLTAGIIGFLAIILFLVIVYKLPGLLAAFALLIYAALLLGLFKLFSITLTLAGIGGFILSLGMAVDANVLIFSRMREELREEKSLVHAIEEGFRRAWPSIRDGNFTTLIVALILFGVGTSFVQGFATTLCLGILMSMLSAILITRSFLLAFAHTRLQKINKLWL